MSVAISQMVSEFMEEGDGNVSYSVRWRVGFGLGTDLPVETNVDLVQVAQAGSIGHHANEDMRQVVDVAFCGTFTDDCIVCHQSSNCDPIRKKCRQRMGLYISARLVVRVSHKKKYSQFW